MERFAGGVIRHRKAVIVMFLAAAVICAVLALAVSVNFNIVDYLPSETQSTKAINIMTEEFTQPLPNASVEIRGVSIQEAVDYKRKLMSLEHVKEVIWLDDTLDITKPLEMEDPEAVEAFYKDGNALFSVVITKDYEKEGVSEIRTLVGYAGTVSGEAADMEFIQRATSSEVLNAFIILMPLIILILIVSTTSWIEPLLFLAAIGMSVIINMGTNAFAPNVSFLTNSVTPILQLAVSLDYAIFLLHSFGARRKGGVTVEEAMLGAIKESFSTVAASASTTLFGFMALLFMAFKIGPDLGLSLGKGIVFSFVSVMVFLPALTVIVYKLIDKTRHREFMPAFSNVNNVLRRLAIPAVVIVVVIIVPCFLGQSRTDFLYGYQSAAASLKEGEENSQQSSFENSTVMVLLVPRGDVIKEENLSNDILSLPHVTSVVSYASAVGSAIPSEFLDTSVTEQFYSENYARILVYTDTPTEGAEAFAAVEAINSAAAGYYPTGVYSAGSSANLYDMKTVVQNDNRITNLIAIVSILAVLLITFKSISLPVFLILTIETAIWVNLSIPYFTGLSINYIGYLVLNTVQLGATVDYAILLTVTYMRNRQSMQKKEAIHAALGTSFRSILVSGATLSTAGFTLAGTSSNPLIADIGLLLGRGTLLSMVMVVVFLPAMLTIFDKFIGKTTYKSNFI
ncbi:MAG: MMPL family transporter [Clostridiales bacterium]|jgi:predicted RND superfamily exporter protein|nr:MMPL family transporter [Clostridiales bacterium]